MDTQLHSLSLAELKKVAKGRRIKHYYIMPRAQLLHLLTLPELPKERIIEKLTIVQLRAEAKAKNIRGFWSLNRGELVDALYPATPAATLSKHQDSDSEQHESPNDDDRNQQGA
jgi:hypothetical protein